MTYSGSCLCQAVKYEITGGFESFYLCHCKYCQKDTGSAHAAILFSRSARLAWLAGQDQISTYNLPSTRHVKSFCKICGSAVPVGPIREGPLAVPAGSLDTVLVMRPNAHLFQASRAAWDTGLEHVPAHSGFPP